MAPVHTVPKYGTKPIRYVTLHFRDRHGAASLRERNRAEITSLRLCSHYTGKLFVPTRIAVQSELAQLARRKRLVKVSLHVSY